MIEKEFEEIKKRVERAKNASTETEMYWWKPINDFKQHALDDACALLAEVEASHRKNEMLEAALSTACYPLDYTPSGHTLADLCIQQVREQKLGCKTCQNFDGCSRRLHDLDYYEPCDQRDPKTATRNK